MKRIIVGLLVVLLIFTFSQSGLCNEELPVYKYKDPGTALLWSILIPGGGQIYNGQVGKGLLFMAGYYGCLLYTSPSPRDS